MTPGLPPQPGGFEGVLAVEKLDPRDGFALLDQKTFLYSEGNLDATSFPRPFTNMPTTSLSPASRNSVVPTP